jgi:DNA-binding transcriptional ArsR family regulator
MDMFSALAEPNRRGIVELLSLKGQLSATEISDKFKVTPQAVSQHLKVLREAELVQVEKKAQQRIYQINPDKIDELEVWVKRLKTHWKKRFNALEKVLEEEKRKMKS